MLRDSVSFLDVSTTEYGKFTNIYIIIFQSTVVTVMMPVDKDLALINNL